MTKLTLKRSCMLVQVNVKICRINEKKKQTLRNALNRRRSRDTVQANRGKYDI